MRVHREHFMKKLRKSEKITGRARIAGIARMKSIFLAICMLTTTLGSDFASATAYALEPEEAAWVEEARTALQEVVQEREVMAVVYLCETYPVKAEPSKDSETVAEVPSGQTVTIQDIAMTDDYQVWERISFYYGDGEYSGYIPRKYLACADERFLEWESTYGMNPSAFSMYTLDGEAESVNVYADIEMFPASYQQSLKVLKDQHPNWMFVPMNTGLDWNQVIAAQIVGGKSLVHKSFPDYTKEGAYDGGNWFYASEDILKLYMDPRNALSENAIFQFEQLTYNETYHTEAALDQFLQNTFMKNDKYAPGTTMTYGHIIWAIGAEKIRRVSPFHLAARIYQEQGDGTSPLISGTYPGYEGLYNYFNVGATGTSNKEVIESGLTYARNAKNEKGESQPWKDAYYSILGGSNIISANYIRKGQDTLYLQKFNVNPKGQYALHTHQYMQNISAPTGEGKMIRDLYEKAGALDSPFVFKIPVFENMPEGGCPMPTASTNVVLQIPEGYDTTVYVDGVAHTGTARNGRMIVNAGNGAAKSAVVYRYNESGVPVGMYVWTLDYVNNAYVATPQPELADLLSYHGFSIRITGKSGIRFKTGIAAELKKQLIETGVNGYKLKEYGTLVMNNANRDKYPMIKGGEKVLSGLSYGINESGVLENKVFETVDGRQRFTSVLVGLPVNQYKTEYAFRGYLVLEKDGVETCVYGPVVAKSIYALSQQVLNLGMYPQGSEADAFLRKLIADADALEQAEAEQAEQTEEAAQNAEAQNAEVQENTDSGQSEQSGRAEEAAQ